MNRSSSARIWPAVLGLVLASATAQRAPAQGANPWDTAAGQACFEKWIAESMSRLNGYNGSADFNARKPWSINRYGVLEGNAQYGPRSVAAPDNFPSYSNNKYWWMWDHYLATSSDGWSSAEWRGAAVPALRPYVTSCFAAAGGGGGGGGGGARLVTQRQSYGPSEEIVVDFSGFPGSQNDWVTVVKASDPANSYGQYFLLQGRQSGTLTFTGLAPGDYEVRGFFDWPNGGYNVQARYPFSVTAAGGGGGGGGGGTAIPANWNTSVGDRRGQNYLRLTFACPPGGTQGSLWGTGVYTDDSSVCTAGVHAGLFTFASGGLVTIEIRPGQSEYVGSSQNGANSNGYGGWDGSYVVVGSAAASLACGYSLGSGIYDKWIATGGQAGRLGCPIMNEAEAGRSPQGTSGRYAEFSGGDGGYIVWSSSGPYAGRAFDVNGCIYKSYKSLGGSTSWLGFPIGDAYDATGGSRQDFEGGYIYWNAQTRECAAYTYEGGGGGGGGGTNSSPYAPTLTGPPNAWDPWLSIARGIALQWQSNGDPDGDQVGFWVNLYRTDYDLNRQAWMDWMLVFEGWSPGGTSMSPGPGQGLIAGSCYAWRVFTVDLSYKSNPAYTSSDWAVFCATS